MAIEVKGLSKRYGVQLAVDSLSFTIGKGEIVGFLGPNGAGKSTTMKMLTGYVRASEGEIAICGFDIRSESKQAKARIGYLPEHNPLYDEMYVLEYLNFIAELYGVSKSIISDVVEKVKLSAEAHKQLGALSKGYRQRVGLAAALLHNPDVLILDEPTTGLDPNQLAEIRALIKEIGKEKTVLFSTHIMQEVEAVCDRVLIINKGKLIADKQLSELRSDSHQTIQVSFDYKVEQRFLEKLKHLESANNVHDATWELVFSSSEDMRPVVFDFAQENGLKILELSSRNKNLETLFQELTTSE